MGLVFFPDNDVNQQRFMRIRKAMEYGARFVHPWTTGEGVTHIIVDSDMQYEDILKHLKLEEIPDEIIVVNQRYPSDCISNQILVNPKQRLYDVIWRRPRANSDKTRQTPQEERPVVDETPLRRPTEAILHKSDVAKAATTSAQIEIRVETGM
jgi:DNA polymerase IV